MGKRRPKSLNQLMKELEEPIVWPEEEEPSPDAATQIRANLEKQLKKRHAEGQAQYRIRSNRKTMSIPGYVTPIHRELMVKHGYLKLEDVEDRDALHVALNKVLDEWAKLVENSE